MQIKTNNVSFHSCKNYYIQAKDVSAGEDMKKLEMCTLLIENQNGTAMLTHQQIKNRTKYNIKHLNSVLLSRSSGSLRGINILYSFSVFTIA